MITGNVYKRQGMAKEKTLNLNESEIRRGDKTKSLGIAIYCTQFGLTI